MKYQVLRGCSKFILIILYGLFLPILRCKFCKECSAICFNLRLVWSKICSYNSKNINFEQPLSIKIKNKFSTKLIAFIFFVLNTWYSVLNTSNAQTATSSPYSRYGVGDVTSKGAGQNFAMGGTVIAVQNDTVPYFFINTGNPASYSNMRLTTAELGFNYNRVLLQNVNTSKTIHSASLAYISFAFPIYKRCWGAGIGLIPFSSVGYKVSDDQIISNIGDVNFLYEGAGGINQLYFGNGIKPFPKLSGKFLRSSKYTQLKSSLKPDKTKKTNKEIRKDCIKSDRKMNVRRLLSDASLGANASYLFGNIENSRRSIFPGSSYAFNTCAQTTTRVSDFYSDYGLQLGYTIDSVRNRKNLADTSMPLYRDLKENVKLLFGINFAAQTFIHGRIDSLSYSYFNNSSGYEIVKDTIENTQNTKGKITLPLSIGFGIGLKKGDKWLVAADFSIQNWSSYSAFNQTQGLKNSMRVSLGSQFVPNSKSENYFKRVNYRIGVRYLQTALELKNTPLTEYAGSIGIGFPVARNYLLQTFSMVNIGAEIGQRGTTTNNLIRENFLKITISFTINDRWFVKPKFD